MITSVTILTILFIFCFKWIVEDKGSDLFQEIVVHYIVFYILGCIIFIFYLINTYLP